MRNMKAGASALSPFGVKKTTDRKDAFDSRFVIIGTAGHIDHGKTALVYALTGKNTDRLKEEQARGISIDIDFAPLRFNDGLLVGMVDVPGHERFIRNMLAGAAGIDAALLTVDINEGIKPQTEEHLAILQILGVSSIVVALTKCDLADAEWVEMVRGVVEEALAQTPYADAPIISTSAVTGAGLPELKAALHQLAMETASRDPGGAFRLPIDKAFSIPGFGTVVSGTVWRGTVTVGDHLDFLPGRRSVRVRGIQSHGQTVASAQAGQRAALNLVGIGHDEIHRGDTVAAPLTLSESRLLDIHVEVLAGYEHGLTHRDRVHVHLGTAQTVGRILLLETDSVEAGGASYAQLLLDHPVVCEPGDHFVIRSYSPITTIGGGHVVDDAPKRLYRRKRPHVIAELQARDSASPLERVVRLAAAAPVTVSAIASHLGYTLEEAEALVDSGRTSGRLLQLPTGWMAREAALELVGECFTAMSEAHRKHRFRPWLARRDVTGPRLMTLTARDFDWVLQEGARAGRFELESGLVRVAGWQVKLSDEEQDIYHHLLETLKQAGIEGAQLTALAAKFPKRDRIADALLHYALEIGDVVQLQDGMLVSKQVFVQALKQIQFLYEQSGDFTVAEVRDLLTSSRKPTVNLLETLDARGITARVGDARKFIKQLH